MVTGQQIWNEIKDKDIDLFAMVTKVKQYCNFIDIDADKCYLMCKTGAALPALETALGDAYICTRVEKYVLVEKVQKLGK